MSTLTGWHGPAPALVSPPAVSAAPFAVPASFVAEGPRLARFSSSARPHPHTWSRAV